MKILQVIVLVVVVCILSLEVKAQIDQLCMTKVYVQDSLGNQIEDAKVRFFDREIYYSDKFQAYTYSRLLLPSEIDEINGTEGIVPVQSKIKAKGFDLFERQVKFRCNKEFLKVILKRKKSNDVETLEISKILSGIVTDPVGEIPNVKVKAIDKSGKVFETKTTDNGFYWLNLFPEIYKVEFLLEGYDVYLINELIIENSTENNIIKQDAALKVSPIIETMDNSPVYSAFVKGKVKDKYGAFIPSALITFKDQKGNSYKTKSNEQGDYAVELLAGNYKIEATYGSGEKCKMTNREKEITISKNKPNRQDIKLFLKYDNESECLSH